MAISKEGYRKVKVDLNQIDSKHASKPSNPNVHFEEIHRIDKLVKKQKMLITDNRNECGIQKNSIDDFICKAETETQMLKTYGY